MKDREIVIDSFPVSDGRVLEMSVGYTLGGINFLSGGSYPRGYDICARLIKVEEHFCVQTYGDGSSCSAHLFDADRFNARKLAQLAAVVRDDDRYAAVRDQVLARTRTTIVTTSTPSIPAAPPAPTGMSDPTTASNAARGGQFTLPIAI